MKNEFIVVTTTYPNLRDAKNLGKTLIEKKLAACVHFSKVESMYFWDKKLQQDKEILVSIKTKNSCYEKVEKIIKEQHYYEIPQIVSTQINQGFAPYLNWIDLSLRNHK